MLDKTLLTGRCLPVKRAAHSKNANKTKQDCLEELSPGEHKVTSMKDYRDLTISGTREQLINTMAEIEKSLDDGWQRDRTIEENGRERAGLGPDRMRFCFTCTPTTSRKGAMLVLMSNRQNDLWMSNIVPHDLGQLSYDEFNCILEEFLHRFARPAAAETGAVIKTSSGIVTIDDWFSKETAEKLRRFLSTANGSTNHPEDDKRWMAFLLAAHREEAKVHADLLRRWLKEDAGCDEYHADKLASEYQFSQEIFCYAEEYEMA